MHLDVVTPRGTIVSDAVDEVVAPGVSGEFGVLPGHTPFVTALKPGVLTFKKGGQARSMAISAGFAEVKDDKVVVLTSDSAKLEEIDAATARRELEDVERAIKDWHEPDPETSGAPGATRGPSRGDLELRRDWAQARIDATQARGKL